MKWFIMLVIKTGATDQSNQVYRPHLINKFLLLANIVLTWKDVFYGHIIVKVDFKA